MKCTCHDLDVHHHLMPPHMMRRLGYALLVSFLSSLSSRNRRYSLFVMTIRFFTKLLAVRSNRRSSAWSLIVFATSETETKTPIIGGRSSPTHCHAFVAAPKFLPPLPAYKRSPCGKVFHLEISYINVIPVDWGRRNDGMWYFSVCRPLSFPSDMSRYVSSELMTRRA